MSQSKLKRSKHLERLSWRIAGYEASPKLKEISQRIVDTLHKPGSQKKH
jgi:hypothetical protein